MLSVPLYYCDWCSLSTHLAASNRRRSRARPGLLLDLGYRWYGGIVHIVLGDGIGNLLGGANVGTTLALRAPQRYLATLLRHVDLSLDQA